MTIRLLRFLFFLFCMLTASISDARRLSLMGAVVFGQGHGHRGQPPHRPNDLDTTKMSSMGRLAHLVEIRRRGGGAATAATAGDNYPDNDTVAGGQAQPSIAVDSTGQHIVIGTNDAGGFGLNPISVSGFKYSDDGGRTFTDGGPLPITTPISFLGTTAYPGVFGDPEVKYLGGSNFIYFSIVVVSGGSGGPAQTLGFHRSTDFGHTWTGPFEIPPATNPNGLLYGLSVDAADKPFAAVNPDTGRVLVSWSNFTPFALGGVEISTTFSDNILAANPVWSLRSVIAATDIDGQSSIPRFAGNGSSNVYIAWQRFSGDNSDDIGFARSTDNGATWSNPINAAPSAFFTMDQVLGDDRVSSAPGLAVDNSSGLGRGNIYLVYSNNNLKDGGDIAFQRSTDGGLSFTSPILINSRPGNDRAQWFPWVTVDNSSGRVYVFYYDQGIDTSGDLTQTTYQFSDDGGLTWKQPMPLTDRPFKAGWGKDMGHPNLGDYNQAVAQNGELFAAWAQTELLLFANGLPSVHMETPRVVFKRVPASSAKVTLTSNFSGATFTDDDGNGFIDAGERVRFKLPLTNYLTNPSLNPGVITGIVATLSATTSTVTVVQGTSGYPSIGPGASATNDTDFIVQLSPGYVRGTPLELALNVGSNQGSTVLFLTRSTGTPQAIPIFQENFDSTAPGTLPAGWLIQHLGGNNTVGWTTSNAFNAGNNGAFHINANDGLAGNSNRWERLLSPLIQVPAESEYVTLDFDVKYDTQDDPNFNVLAHDGFLLRIGDYGPSSSPPAFLRAVLAEAFEEEFTTGSLKHYPKHFPRSNSTAYLQDLSAWAGDSAGLKHVHTKLNGMAGRSIRLWWEYTQDTTFTCKDVRPAASVCGVLFDNLVVQSVITVQADLSVTKSITSGTAISGQNISYRIDAVNNGPTLDVGSTVTDNLPPLLSFVSCGATGGGTCSGSGNNQTVTLPAGSGPQTITLVAAISCSAAGGTPLTNTATITSVVPDPDSSNNFSSVSTNIVNPPPVLSCPVNIVTTAGAGQTSAITNFTVTATDNCPLPQGAIAANPASGSAFLLGTTKVTATATDSGGAQSSCSFYVTVSAPTTTSVKSITGQHGGSVTLTATVGPTPLAGQTATGTVNFFVNGSPVGSSSLNASGVAFFPYTIVQAPGTYSIAANYVSTSPFFLNSTGSGQLTVANTVAVYATFSGIGGTFATNGGGLAVVSDAGGRPVTIPAGEIPELTAASPDGLRLYVGFSTSSGYSVHVIDTSDNHIVTTAKICSNTSTLSCAGGIALSATNRGAYASFSTISGAFRINGGLAVVNDAGGRPLAMPAAGEIPELTAASPDGSRLYVGFSTSSGYSVHVIDTSDNHIVTTAKICSNTSTLSCAGGIGLSATNRGAYASFSTISGAFLASGGGLAFVNDAGGRPVTIPAGEILELTAASPDGSRIYIGFSTSSGYSVHVMDTSDNHIVTTAKICSNTSTLSCEGGNGLSATNSGAYASFSTISGALFINGGGLAVLNDAGGRPVSIPAGEIPELMAVAPDGSRLYVGFSASSGYSVHVIDTSDNHIVTTVKICANASCRAGNGLSAAITSPPPQ